MTSLRLVNASAENTDPGTSLFTSFITALLTISLLPLAGCVSKQTYNATQVEAQGLEDELRLEQAEVQTLDAEVMRIQTANQTSEATLAELRARLEEVTQALAEAKRARLARFAALTDQANSLKAQKQVYLRKIKQAKRAEKELQALVTQYEDETTQAEAIETLGTGPSVVGSAPEAPTTVPAPTSPPVPQVASAPSPPMTITTGPSTASLPVPQPTSPASAQHKSSSTQPTTETTVARPAPIPQPIPTPPPTEESWFGSVIGWFASMWDWLFS